MGPPERALDPPSRQTSSRIAADDGAGRDEEEAGYDWSRWLPALRRHQVTLACVALIVATLIWKAAFLSHFYFRQDDFNDLDLALKSGLSWGYLTHLDTGHLFPAVMLICWVLARVALYNWPVAATIELIMIAGASLAAWRLLRTLLGNRPAILIPLALYLLTPLAFPDYDWWIAGIETIPLQIAICMALNSHVRYAWTGRFRHAIAAAAWVLFGMCFFEKSVLIPLLLFAVTAGYLSAGQTLTSAARVTAVRLWRGWLLYLALAAAYAGLFFAVLSSSGTKTGFPSLHAIWVFASKLVLLTLLPGVLGGPWRWFHGVGQADAYSYPPAGLEWLSLVIVLAFIAASVLVRTRASRAWVILAGWVIAADMLPVVVGRVVHPQYAAILGMTPRYAADTPVVVAVAVALAFWPVRRAEGVVSGTSPSATAQVEPATSAGPRDFFTGRWNAVAIGTLAVVVVGSIWSVQRLQTLTASAGAADRSYIATARVALAKAPAGTVIVSQLVPSTIMTPLFGEDAETSAVLGPLSNRGRQVTWTSRPQGTIGDLRVFGDDGRLWPAALAGSTTEQLLGRQGCATPTRSRIVLRFAGVSTPYATVLRVGYVASAAAAGTPVTVTYGSFTGDFIVQPHYTHNVYFAVRGSAPDVVLQTTAGAGGICFARAVAGTVTPALGGAIPAKPQP